MYFTSVDAIKLIGFVQTERGDKFSIWRVLAVLNQHVVKIFPMNNFKSQVGLKVRELRKTKGISQMALAEKADLSVDTIGDTERGVKSPSDPTLEKLAFALEVPITEFSPSPLPSGRAAK